MGVLVNAVAHGHIAGDRIVFSNLDGGEGIIEGQEYFVIATGLTADAFEFSETSGGSAFAYTTDIVSGDVATAPTYSLVADGVMDPPSALSAPGSCVLTSTAVVNPDGTVITRLIVTITQPTGATLRHTVVTLTAGTDTMKVIIPVGQTVGSISSVRAGVSFTGSAVSYDTFGLASAATVSAAHVTAGDVTAPPQVTSPAAAGGIRSAFVTWSPSNAEDLGLYEVQVDTTNVFGTATTHKVKVSALTVSDLAPGTWYFRVRAVDLTGNLGSYSSTVSAVSRLVTGGTDIVANSITANDILAGSITATEIAAGSITATKLAVGLPTTGGNLIKNGSFEDADSTVLAAAVSVTTTTDTALLGGWEVTATSRVKFATSVNAKTGTRILTLLANSTETSRGLFQLIPVIAGRTYRFTGWEWKAANGGAIARMRLDTYDASQVQVTAGVVTADNATTTVTFVDKSYTVPTDGTVSYLRVLCISGATPAGADETFAFEDISLVEVPNRLTNTAATVLIDDTGIAITNGKLSFQDQFGNTTMDGYGFDSSWLKFINTRVYNGDFTAGSTSDVGVSQVNTGSTIADYKASLASGLPYWVVVASGSDVKIVTDATASGGKALTLLQTGASQVNTIYQDVPITPGQMPSVFYNRRFTFTGASDFDWGRAYSYRDSDHALIGSAISATLSGSTPGRAAYDLDRDDIGIWGLGLPPTNAIYLRVQFTVTFATYTAGTKFAQVWFSDISAPPVEWSGYTPVAGPAGWADNMPFASAANLATVAAGVGGARITPIYVHAPMVLQGYTLMSTDTASLRTAEARLYRDIGTADLQFVTGSDAAWSFTPSAASRRPAITSVGSIYLRPGVYWLCLRNTSTARAFGLGTEAAGSLMMSTGNFSNAAVAALGATLNPGSWGISPNIMGIVMLGSVMGSTTWT
jgi:hypothetical protein